LFEVRPTLWAAFLTKKINFFGFSELLNFPDAGQSANEINDNYPKSPLKHRAFIAS
jgi:hypothetical protein